MPEITLKQDDMFSISVGQLNLMWAEEHGRTVLIVSGPKKETIIIRPHTENSLEVSVEGQDYC